MDAALRIRFSASPALMRLRARLRLASLFRVGGMDIRTSVVGTTTLKNTIIVGEKVKGRAKGQTQ